jgi:hypothetical protein
MIDLATASAAEILEASRLAHLRYRENLPRMVPGPNGRAVKADGDQAAAHAALWEAARLRAEAHAADPIIKRVALANEPETHDHDALLEFYADVLSR